jgi:hypothetical protein
MKAWFPELPHPYCTSKSQGVDHMQWLQSNRELHSRNGSIPAILKVFTISTANFMDASKKMKTIRFEKAFRPLPMNVRMHSTVSK